MCVLSYSDVSDSAIPWTIALQAPATAKSLQSCPTLCDPIDGSPPGSPVLRILQARTLRPINKGSRRGNWPEVSDAEF